MANPLLEFDPTSEDAANSPLEIWSTSSYGVTAFSVAAPAWDIQWAGSVDTEGSLPSSRKPQNRTVSLTVEVMSATALRNLQAKAAKLAREGGTAKATFPANGETLTVDILAAESFAPQLDITYYVNSGAFCAVDMAFTIKPYGRGAAVTLSGHTATNTKAPLVFTETAVAGDVPGLGSLKLANATSIKTCAIWAVQSRYYDSATTAALLIEAEDGVAGPTSAVNAGYAGASGGGANKVMRFPNVGGTGAAFYSIGTALTHVGTFRVFARVQADTANTGIASLQLGWSSNAFSRFTFNDWVAIETSAGAAIKGSWVIADLGEITIRRPNVGTHKWRADVFAKSTVSADDLDIDWVAFMPVEEGFGVLHDTDVKIPTAGAVTLTHEAAYVSDTTQTYWIRPESYEGDYLLVPPAGLEGRSARFIAFLAGASSGNLTDTVVDAASLDAITATLTYTPRYLVIPSP